MDHKLVFVFFVVAHNSGTGLYWNLLPVRPRPCTLSWGFGCQGSGHNFMALRGLTVDLPLLWLEATFKVRLSPLLSAWPCTPLMQSWNLTWAWPHYGSAWWSLDHSLTLVTVPQNWSWSWPWFINCSITIDLSGSHWAVANPGCHHLLCLPCSGPVGLISSRYGHCPDCSAVILSSQLPFPCRAAHTCCSLALPFRLNWFSYLKTRKSQAANLCVPNMEKDIYFGCFSKCYTEVLMLSKHFPCSKHHASIL